MEPTVVVTGASSGIGREFARIVAQEGSTVFLVERSGQLLDELIAESRSSRARVHALCLDLADPDAGARIEESLAQHGLYCDVLVNSAGFGLLGNAAEIDRIEQLRLLQVNARALTDLTLRFLPGMLARGRGGVLNVGSIASYVPGPRMALYFSSKAYVSSFSLALAAEVAGSGVTVTCLSPGIVRTAFFDRSGMGRTRLIKMLPRSDAYVVAASGWRGFKAGKRVVIPRLADRMIIRLITILPTSFVLWLISRLQRPI